MHKGLVPLIAGVVVSSAAADIVSVTGDATVVSPPADLSSGALVSTTTTYVFQESSNVMFNAPVDFGHFPPIQLNITNVMPTLVNQEVDSHMIHFDVTGIDVDTHLLGTVTFDAPIVGVIISNTRLDATDATLGAPGTIYPFGVTNRGFSNLDDWIRVTSPNVLQFSVRNFNTADQIRVLTEALPVPAPAGVGAFAIGALAVTRRRR